MTNSQIQTSDDGLERLLTPDEVAWLLGKPKATLYAWRSRGLGPAGVRVGNHLRYRRREVERWIDQHTDRPAGAVGGG